VSNVTEVVQALGSWQVDLYGRTPRTILDQLGYCGHIAIVPGRINPAEYGDQILSSARYVGVLISRDIADTGSSISGYGMAWWLGDADDKGDVIESPISISGQTFPNAIRAIISGISAVTEGTLYGAAGTYTGTHQWTSRRKAVDYICQTMGCEWRVNGTGTLDAGPIANLYATTPDCVIQRSGRPGRDITLTGLPGSMDLQRDIADYTTRVVLLAEGEGDAIATGSANIGSTPYKDIHGGTLTRVRVVSESDTSGANAAARAQLQLNRFVGTRNALRLSTADGYEITGKFGVGDYVWVYDPDAGLTDTANEITFYGNRINPIALRIVEATWPITAGHTVAYRTGTGTWIDLTNYVNFSTGQTSLVVGDLDKSLTASGFQPVLWRPSADSSIPAAPTWNTPFSTGAYLDGLGTTLAQVLLSWNTPLNTDGSTVLDGDHFEIQYGLHVASTWTTTYAAWGSTTMLIQDLAPGLNYDFRIRAVDSSGNDSAWSTTVQVTVAPDTTPPSTPAAPTVAASRIAIQVTHTLGKASGGTYNLELDLDHFDVHVGASSGFTPSPSTLVGKLVANVGMLVGNIAAVGSFPVESTSAVFVKVIAVDASGNASPASTAATTTALLIDDAHISDLTVSKVSAGTVSANWLLGASIRTAASGARVELNSSGLQAFNSGGVQTVNISSAGLFTLKTGTSGARIEIDASGLRAYNGSGTNTVDINSSGSATILGEIRSALSGRRIVFNPAGATQQEIRFYPTSGNSSAIQAFDDGLSSAGILLQSGQNSANHLSQVAASAETVDILTYTSIGATRSRMRLGNFGLSGNAISFDGTWVTSGAGDNAIHVGRLTVSGTSGVVSHSIIAGTPIAVSQMRAGNVAAYTQTDVSIGQFNWGWAGPSLTAGSDYIHFCCWRV
jgi:chitodextrinase